MKYKVVLYWSQEDEASIGEIPELAGCMADRQTVQKCLQNLEQIATEWLETAQELGRSIPKPK